MDYACVSSIFAVQCVAFHRAKYHKAKRSAQTIFFNTCLFRPNKTHTNTPFVYVKFMPNLHHAYPVYRTIHSQTLYKLNYTIRITQYKLHNTNNTINIPLHTCDHLFTQTFTYECINYIAVILFEYLDND